MKLILILLISLPLYAQNKATKAPKKSVSVIQEPATPVVINKYEEIDKQITTDTTQVSIQQLSNRFQTLPSEEAKVRAIYMWVSKNIAYDVNQLFSFHFGETSDLSTDQILRTRKGVCVDYALLFNELCTNVGLKSYTVEGYVKKGKVIGDFGHAWNAVRIHDQWYLFDSTWGAGYVSERTFTQAPNDVYFMVPPDEFIYSHMPFDPIWEFLEHPITNQEFYNNLNKSSNISVAFSVNDSLKIYDQQPHLKHLEAAEKRIEKNGNVNFMTETYLHNIKYEILSTYYSRGVDAYNETVKLIKDFTNYRIARFTPLKSDEDIKKMLIDIESQLAATKRIVAEIPLKNKDVIKKVDEINKLLVELDQNVKEQNQFLTKYFKVWKPLRKAML
ncbi:transglutaminase domain-containing protein [Spirosoma foliorum]|uniref:Transglutaminase-like domain-containing protein n=1 Tax=Spirosoma foliorum TaxID=2710596 RepID=A0A7G5GWL6_9BACT|nr:transglutaminase domain-containing protein [Spirosoma foliorum]QMW03258.1 hypothetical protein H3H32_36240 [Spirosoma foliorum]